MRSTWRAGGLATVLLVTAGTWAPADVIPANGPLVGQVFTYTTRSVDTPALIGARFGITPAALMRRNGLPPNGRVPAGTTLSIDNRHILPDTGNARLVINIAQRLLYFNEPSGTSAYPVGVGTRPWPTPTGAFTVVAKEVNPTWDVPASIQDEMRRQGKPVVAQVPPGPGNPLGAHFIRLSFTNLGIHGTIEPGSVYRYASHGCIRMQPWDVAALFPRVAAGMAGLITYEPVLAAVVDGRVLLEVHPDGYRRADSPLQQARVLLDRMNASALVDWTLVATAVREQDGMVTDVTR